MTSPTHPWPPLAGLLRVGSWTTRASTGGSELATCLRSAWSEVKRRCMILILRCHTVTPTQNNCKPTQWARSIKISMSREVSNPQSLIASHYSAEAATPIMADMPCIWPGPSRSTKPNIYSTLPFCFQMGQRKGKPHEFLGAWIPCCHTPPSLSFLHWEALCRKAPFY